MLETQWSQRLKSSTAVKWLIITHGIIIGVNYKHTLQNSVNNQTRTEAVWYTHGWQIKGQTNKMVVESAFWGSGLYSQTVVCPDSWTRRGSVYTSICSLFGGDFPRTGISIGGTTADSDAFRGSWKMIMPTNKGFQCPLVSNNLKANLQLIKVWCRNLKPSVHLYWEWILEQSKNHLVSS